ncbi:MAG: hypothetical protein RQ751_08075, partial [Longimicrobiales bacterium]|nr:hypothetical protein [Longimicrobiales bacterium]
LLLLGAGLSGRVAAIAVAPTAVYLRDGAAGEAVTLYNPSDTPEEVTVSAVFGYPTTDSDGRLYLLVDSAGDDPRSAVPWIQALPRRLVVPPGERRTVRLLARPPAGTPDGEYWARLVFAARGQTLPVAGAPDSTGVQVGLSLEVRTVIAVSYRRGAVSTGVDVVGFEPRVEGDSLVVRPDFRRTGAAAYIGRLDFTLLDATGTPVRRWDEQIAVYRTYHRRYAYPVDDLPAGRYTLALRMGTDREDVPPHARLPTEPVERTAEVVLP